MATTEWRTPRWTIGDRMAKARRDAGLSQQEMADLLTTPEQPVSKQTVSNWENGKNQPRRLRERLDQWCEITHTPLAWILDLPDYPGDQATRV